MWLLDQFGVLHDGKVAYPQAVEACRALAEAGRRLVVISNSSRRAFSVFLLFPALRRCGASRLLNAFIRAFCLHRFGHDAGQARADGLHPVVVCWRRYKWRTHAQTATVSSGPLVCGARPVRVVTEALQPGPPSVYRREKVASRQSTTFPTTCGWPRVGGSLQCPSTTTTAAATFTAAAHAFPSSGVREALSSQFSVPCSAL